MYNLFKSIKGFFIMTDSFMGVHNLTLGAIIGGELPLLLVGVVSIYAIIHAVILIVKGPKWDNRTPYEKVISVTGIVIGVFLLIGILLSKK